MIHDLVPGIPELRRAPGPPAEDSEGALRSERAEAVEGGLRLVEMENCVQTASELREVWRLFLGSDEIRSQTAIILKWTCQANFGSHPGHKNSRRESGLIHPLSPVSRVVFLALAQI